MIQRILAFGLGTILLACGLTTRDPTASPEAAPVQAVVTIPDSGFKLLTRTPIHEAIAETLLAKPRPPPIVPKEPPVPIEESQPDQKQGDNVQWIGGYWAWDDDCNFVWVSGIWHDVPPGRQWVPGYWTRAGDGWQRIPGFWAQYADSCRPPPASVDARQRTRQSFTGM